jgi:hypothetical protein
VSALSAMPFGKYKGTPLSAVPADYLTWLAGKLDELREPLRGALVTELARRASAMGARTKATAPTTPEEDAVCAICGLGATASRPVVHRAWVDEGAF